MVLDSEERFAPAAPAGPAAHRRMPDPIQFDTDLYRRDAVVSAAEKFSRRARVEVAESGSHLIARLEPLDGGGDPQSLRDEFCNEVFSATAQQMRGTPAAGRAAEAADGADPPWQLLAPFEAGMPLALGWTLESLAPVRGGATTLVLAHADLGRARVAIRRNGGAPLGVAHTGGLDFMLMNGGSGAARTEESVGRVLRALAQALQQHGDPSATAAEQAGLLPHSEAPAPQGVRAGGGPDAARRVAPRIDLDRGAIAFEIEEPGLSRLALYDAVLRFADRGYVYLTRPDAARIAVHVRARPEAAPEAVKALAADVTRALNHALRRPGGGAEHHVGLPTLPHAAADLDALLAELAAADPRTLGLGFQPERGPGHEGLRVLNIRGTGACNSDCVFCVEKFDPAHRTMPKADATRQFILDNAGQFDMLFFASGEPTIHPKLFEYVELARSVGFTSFGMSSHFRTFADPAFALRVLQAGFEYFDISLHAADAAGQLRVNPIGDDGDSLFEALKGIAVLYRLAEATGVRISLTHKIVVSRLNVLALEDVFRATYDRGVRHFILQPVRSMNLEPERQALLTIGEDEIIPHLNAFLRRTEGLGATVKPYGFSRQHLLTAAHVEAEQNRVKNVYGRVRGPGVFRPLQETREERPTDGRHWVEMRMSGTGHRFHFASSGAVPLLDEALERGHELPFGCRMGSCGQCCARLLEGEVDQRSQFFLSEEQVRDGYVCLCQAKARGDVVLELCTDDELDAL
ncbi:MAG: 2Fe-2S iron-sulfur cluster-binding protein [Candidatus Binatia bacterium]